MAERGPAASPARHRQPPNGRRGRAAVLVLGEVVVTTGLILVLYTVWTLYWTNISANDRASEGLDRLRRQWEAPAAGEPRRQPRSAGGAPALAVRPGEPFAAMYIPRLGRDWARPVLEGVGDAELAAGIGHYPGTATPGQVGNFALAGHRATHGEPFAYLDRLVPGDLVYVQTRGTWWTYRITGSEIVMPTEISVLLPVPRQPGKKATKATITLTTCNPRWGSTERLIVYGELTAESRAAPPSVPVR